LILCLTLGAGGAAYAQDLPSQPVSMAGGHVVIGTDMSVAMSTKKDDLAWFNYTDYEHSTMRMLRLSMTARLHINDHLSFLGDVRSENGDTVRPYALYVRVRPWQDRPVDIQAGLIPPTFGAFSRRAYANGNPLIGYPLAYQYLTSLRPDAVPANADELLRMRARGWRPIYSVGSQTIATGMPMITAFRWDTGVQVRVGPERLSASVGVTNGTVSDPRTKDNNSGKQIATRLQWVPVVGFVLGASGAHGPYLSTDVVNILGGAVSSTENALGFDVEYSRDHWLVRGEGIWNRWDMPTVSGPLDARSAFIEGTYKLRPRLFLAARADKLAFNKVVGSIQTRTWDAPVTRVEAGFGAYVQRNLLVRGVYQYNWRDGGLTRRLGQFAAQLQFWL
jgi:hypothetical protein